MIAVTRVTFTILNGSGANKERLNFRVFLCIYVCGVYAGACSHVCTETRGGCQVAFSVTFCLSFIDTASHTEPGTRLVAANPSILLALPLLLSTVVTGSTQLLMELQY